MRALLWGMAAALLAGAAWAQEDSDIPWVQVDLGGGFAIDVPAAVAARVKPPKDAPKGVLMSFSVSAGAPGTLSCELSRGDYTVQATRDMLAAKLAKADTENFCKVNSATISGFQAGGSVAGNTDGLPSATCLSAYADSSQQAEGRVLTMDVVAGKKSYYQLVCLNAFDDKDGAVAAYAMRWSPIVTRMQKSFRLAADEK